MKLKLISIGFIAAGLVGCGGGGGNSAPAKATPSKTLKGVAIDGYISGATAFLDINYNGVWDSGEPKSITDDEGRYELPFIDSKTDECLDYAPIVVNVPVGAIDADSPNSPITEPYKLVFPPVMALKSNPDIKSTTPLTTMLWGMIQADLYKGGLNSCSDLKTAVTTQNKIIDNVREHDHRIARRYNISVEELYGDFVKDQNTEVYNLAQKMMPAIKKSYQETKVIQKANPNAYYAYVDYFWKYWDESTKTAIDKWYKVESVSTDSKLVETEHEVSSDLNTELALSKRIERNSQTKSGVVYDKEAWFLLNDNGVDYKCLSTETLTQQAQRNSLTVYTVANRGESKEPDWPSCLAKNVVNGYNQSLKVTVYGDYENQMTKTQAAYHFFSGNIPHPELINLSAKLSSLSRDDLDALNYLSSNFDENTGHGSHSWNRFKYEYILDKSSDVAQTITSKDSNGKWGKEYFYRNGTSSRQCSSDGVNWSKKGCK
ncbi:hypothetical protein Q5H80_19445 [Vibrio sp. SNU_ST1]|uniref:hypothetical protein n=1 Tax=Vibrio sp. SNU_ST1 TaxID=3064001 RepID=UPI00272AB4C3|nr:hypothetical protein [Vibrio sp. SNU_ST1]WKY59747.1 hypothetical protein Q5H80_19445 [Vibrio sp. SNU_ST1]